MKTRVVQTRLTSHDIAKLVYLLGNHYGLHVKTISRLLSEAVRLLISSGENLNLIPDLSDQEVTRLLLSYGIGADTSSSSPKPIPLIDRRIVQLERRLKDE